jgi:hypothetical protein
MSRKERARKRESQKIFSGGLSGRETLGRSRRAGKGGNRDLLKLGFSRVAPDGGHPYRDFFTQLDTPPVTLYHPCLRDEAIPTNERSFNRGSGKGISEHSVMEISWNRLK